MHRARGHPTLFPRAHLLEERARALEPLRVCSVLVRGGARDERGEVEERAGALVPGVGLGTGLGLGSGIGLGLGLELGLGLGPGLGLALGLGLGLRLGLGLGLGLALRLGEHQLVHALEAAPVQIGRGLPPPRGAANQGGQQANEVRRLGDVREI